MISFILKRLAGAVPVMGVVALVVFALLFLTPGDPAAVIAGDHANAEEIARIRVQLGLDRPLHVQFGLWIGRLLTGDLGVSIFSQVPVTQLILQRLEPTVSLGLTTLALAIPVALVIGVVAARSAGKWADRAAMLFAVIGFSMPIFMLGYCLVYLFAIELEILPVQGFVSIREGIGRFLEHMILPAITLGVVYVALLARITRTSMLEVLHEDYVRSARARGVGELGVLVFHVLRNAAVPIVTMIGISLAIVISGSVVVESVYNLPGIGGLLIDAVLKRDYPVIQGVVLMFSFVYVIVNLAIDIAYAFLDPRIRY